MRACADCGADISARGMTAKRCVSCAKDRRLGKALAWRDANREHVREQTRLQMRRWLANVDNRKKARDWTNAWLERKRREHK